MNGLRNHEFVTRLDKAVRLLQSYTTSRSGSAGMLSADRLKPLQKLHQDVAFHNASLPRLIMVGEFKAGKSTLINALLGGEFAPVDLFEMTAWIARYWPATDSFCRMTVAGRQVEALSMSDFLDKCQRRLFPEEELRKIERVDIGVAVDGVNFCLIDCPGIGSITRDNERKMIDALEDADVILWVVDVDSIGGAREGGLLNKLLGYGMPAIAILAKCDLLDDPEETEAIREYLCRNFQVTADNVFPTSASQACEDLRNGRKVSEESGVPALRRHLTASISTRNLEVRKQSEKAHLARMKDLAVEQLETLESDLSEIVTSVGKFTSICDNMKNAVQAQLEFDVERVVRERMFGESREAMLDDFEGRLKSGNGVIAQDAVTAVFKKHLGELYLDVFWQNILSTTLSNATGLWAGKLKGVQADLENLCQAFQASAWQEISLQVTPQTILSEVEALTASTFETGIKTTLGIAGFATAYAAWLGPAAAQVTLGVAATGVGLPIAVMGAVVTVALTMHKKRLTMENLRVHAETILDQYVEDFILNILRPHFFPKISELNEEIKGNLVSSFVNSASVRLPDGDINTLVGAVKQCKQELVFS